jgi:hypothetical protein
MVCVLEWTCVEVSIGSLHPHHPGDSHVVEEAVLLADVEGGIVIVAEGTVDVVVIGASLQPNQPGVRHVDVVVVVVVVVLTCVEVVVVVEVEVGSDVVLSSRHPHQPGVLHVAVRVAVLVFGALDVDEVVVSV